MITTHDGFTLADLVRYNEKHNLDNPHDNGDGTDHNFSWNCGVEGPTDDPEIEKLRARQQRNLLASLLLSQGTPLILAGDELGRSQRGNNNAYCQDSELSWLDWAEAERSGSSLHAFTRQLLKLRRENVVFRRQHPFTGHVIPGTDVMDVVWLNMDGTARMLSDWATADDNFIAFMMSGLAGDYHLSATGERTAGQSVFVGMNASPEDRELWVPDCGSGTRWNVVIDTCRPDHLKALVQCGDRYVLGPRALVLMLSQAGD
jgi:isoamylase